MNITQEGEFQYIIQQETGIWNKKIKDTRLIKIKVKNEHKNRSNRTKGKSDTN